MKNQNLRWYHGLSGFWFKECGCANFIIPSIIFTLITVIQAYFIVAFGDQKAADVFSFTIVFSSIFSYAGTSWQLIKLKATEWHLLVPDYLSTVLKQCRIYITLINGLLALCTLITQDWYALLFLIFVNIYGLLFTKICTIKPSFFQYSAIYILFLAILTFVPYGFSLINILSVLIFLCGAILYWLNKKHTNTYYWNNESYAYYKQGIQTGWAPTSTQYFSGFNSTISNFFFPLSYFAGNGLVQYTGFITALCILDVLLITLLNFTEKTLFIFSNISFFVFYLCQWARLQKGKAWELLFVLPLYNNQEEAKSGLVKANLKLSIYISSLCFILATVYSFADKSFTLYHVIAFTLLNFSALNMSAITTYIIKKLSWNCIVISITLIINISLIRYLLNAEMTLLPMSLMSIYAFISIFLNTKLSRFL